MEFLEVETTVSGSDEKHLLLIERRPGTLSPEQVKSARAALARLKYHPRESLPNRTALARAEALYVELTGFDRQLLRNSIAAVRGALETQDSAVIDAAREQLTALMASSRTH